MNSKKGIYIGVTIIFLWCVHLLFFLFYPLDWSSPIPYVAMLLQTHLYTGLFITAHDSMHGLVSKNKRLNEWIGRMCTTLFAFNFYGNLFKKHHLHHKHVASEHDPDYHESDNFFIWYLSFARQYINIWQIVLMAITYNVLKLFIPTENLISIWMIPSILSTFQLFYFGTYLPHRGAHSPDNIHKSRSQTKNDVWAFLTCYFFGYHYEHHASPGTPWYKLPQVKRKFEENKRL